MPFVASDNRAAPGDLIESRPNLVAEILSSGNSRSEIESKLADYPGIGARECVLVSPQARTVEVLQLDGNERRGLSIWGVG